MMSRVQYAKDCPTRQGLVKTPSGKNPPRTEEAKCRKGKVALPDFSLQRKLHQT
jgi:hypothetical protein